ncbi:MAG: hypothetical protein UMU75_09185 [Halomonas sp.]|nr:hypothetical protein [Halomonas sp.]
MKKTINRAFLLLLVLAMAVSLAGCAGKRLSSSMASINREYGELQNEALLLNILRRSHSLPAHFTSLASIRGNSRMNAGANLSVPFGHGAPASFDLSPHLSMSQGPSFEVAMQDNQEFYRGYVAPIGPKTINYYLQQDMPEALLLSLFIDQIVIRQPGKETEVINTPSQPSEFEAFQRELQWLLGQGMTMEQVSVVEHYGQPVRLDRAPSLDQVLAVHREGMTVKETQPQHYQLSKTSDAGRFCFEHPTAPLLKLAHCTGAEKQFDITDPVFFGSTGGASIVFTPPGELGSIKIYTRSIAEVMDYLGGLVRLQHQSQAPLTIQTPQGPQPIITVEPLSPMEPALVTTQFDGTLYGIPEDQSAGLSGTVLTILSQLLAQAQSVKDLPVSDTITIIGE